jgi:hypothetical protein
MLVWTSGRTTEDKNALCPPTGMPHTPFDYLRAALAGIQTELGWRAAPDLQKCLEHSLLNLLSGLAADDPAILQDSKHRFLAVLSAAFDKLQVFTSRATARERARIFGPAQP